MISDLSDATPEQLLRAAESTVRRARRAEVEKLRILLAWADLHSGDPQAEPGAVPVDKGGPRLVTLGGEGTPGVSDLSLLEIAIARHEGVFATRRALADAFDLRHRLPTVWAGVLDLRCETWLARKVAALSRRLTREQARLVDTAVAAALDQAPSRVLAIAEAKVIEADPAAHAERIRRDRHKKGVWYPTPSTGDQLDDDSAAGLGTVFARLDEADVAAQARLVEDLATALADHAPDVPDDQRPVSMDHWRAEAFAMLADPAAVLAFLDGVNDQPPAERPDADPDKDRRPAAPAELVIHLGTDAAGDLGPVARVEGTVVGGPRLLDQVRDLLARHAHVTVQPVIDLHTGRSVNGYEHPADVRRRTELRTAGDVFPHASGLFTKHGRPPDHDHTTPYDEHGPPGQTGDHNDTPLARHHHRAKTHLGYTVFQLGPDRWVWGTPHGLYRLVGGGGTTPLTAVEYHRLRRQSLELAGDLAG